jgi:hypothetical protein
MLRWFHALMPKEERFFELFARHSHAVLAGAQALRAMTPIMPRARYSSLSDALSLRHLIGAASAT